MARQDSSSDLAGRLGASLTPRMNRSTATSQRERNSGLFDMSALYTEALDQVMRRARTEVHLAPLARAPRLPWPPISPPESGYPRPLAPELEMEVPLDFGDPFAAPRRRGRGLGWFGIAVAWLATVTIGAVLATTVPAHAFPRSNVRAAIAAASAATKASPSESALVVAPAAAWTAVPVTRSGPVALALAAPAISPPVIAPGASVPVTVATAAGPGVSSTAAPAPKRLPKASETSLAPVARPRPIPALAPSPVVAPAAVSVAAPSPRAAPEKAEKPKVVASPASTAGTSLEDLIRHEVQAESGKAHH
jgi:hypothetical protein